MQNKQFLSLIVGVIAVSLLSSLFTFSFLKKEYRFVPRPDKPNVQVEEKASLDQVEPEEPLSLDDLEEQAVQDSELEPEEGFEIAKHSTYFLRSDDGETWDSPELLAKYSSVPDIVALEEVTGPFAAGTLLVYFVDGVAPHGDEDLELGMKYSTDNGETWSGRVYTRMEGAPSGSVVVDPGVVKLDDGRLRLYFFDFPSKPPSFNKSSDQSFVMHSAVSEDGVNFVYEKEVYVSDTLITDPDVVEFNDEWLMYLASHEHNGVAVLASDDPLAFDDPELVEINGIPSALVVDGDLWVFGCGVNGISRAFSDDGVNVVADDTDFGHAGRGIHCDPSFDQLADGSFVGVFKFQDEKDISKRPLDQQQSPTPGQPPQPPQN